MSRSPAGRDPSSSHLSSDRVLQPAIGSRRYCTLLNGYHTCYTEPFVAVLNLQAKRYVSARYECCRKESKSFAPETHRRCLRAWPPHPIGFFNLNLGLRLAFGHGVGVGLWERPIIHRLYSLVPRRIKGRNGDALETYEREGIMEARIEEMTVITGWHPEVISNSPAAN